MPTHKILCDLDVGGEVKGLSLDINGNADISGTTTCNNTVTIIAGGPKLNIQDSSDDDDQQINFVNNSGVTDYMIRTTDPTGGGGSDGFYIGSVQSDGEVALFTNNTTALTLDTSQNATFAGTLVIPGDIQHAGDTTTYFGFHADDQWRVVTNSTERLEVSNSGIKLGGTGATVSSIQDQDDMSSNSATALATQQSIKAYVDSSVASVAEAANLNAIDDRDMAPEDYGYTNDLKIFFSTKEGLEAGSGSGSNYQDVLYLNSYSDASGGDANILAFDKSEMKIYHYQADQAATNWGTAKEIAYTAGPTFTGTPAAPTANAGTNTTQLATTAFVTTAVSNLVDSAPGALNTLNELAAAINDDASFSTTITNSIAAKLPLAGGTLTDTLFINHGSSDSNLVFQLNGANKWLIGRDNSPDSFRIYNYGTSSAALNIATSDNTATFAGAVTVTGNITANGNIVGDDSTSITNIDNIQLDNVMADADTTTRIGLGSTSMEFLVADSDVMDLNETTLNVSGTLVAKKHKLAITSSTDGNADGDIVYFGSTTSMDTGKIYYLNSSGAWALADADAESTAKGMLGVALGSASNTNGVLIRGMVTLDHDPGTQGDTLFLSTTAGTASSTAPSGNGDIVRVIGYCLNSSNGQVYFNPDGTFVEVTA